uniref:Proton-coupled folate transporter-like n=1 Tax=Halisarca dujardinii TaxID=2583056 RepID=A0A7L8Y7N7_HALDU|nr:proton-coupled folate transporter-like [Halisarca dujardinii]QSX72299.1 solute carrier family 46 member 1 [Halisarca dujardinii]
MAKKEESQKLLASSIEVNGDSTSSSKTIFSRAIGKVLAFRETKIISVEVAVFLYCFAMYLSQPVSQQFMYQYFEVQYLRQTGLTNLSISGMCLSPELLLHPCPGQDTTIENCARTDTSFLIRDYTVITTVIMSISILFIGPLTDKLGRKFALYIATAGAAVSSSFILFVVFFNAPIRPLILAGGALNGLTGGLGATLIGSFAYVSDFTSSRYRTLRLGLISAMLFSAGAISQVLGGVWLNLNNCTYEHVIFCSIGINVLEVVFVIFGFPESRKGTANGNRTDATKRCKFCDCGPKQFLDVFKVAIVRFVKGFKIFLRLKLTTVELWLSLIISALYAMNFTAIQTFTVEFLKGYPLFMDPQTIGIFFAVTFALGGVFAVVLLPILSVVLKLPDPLIALLCIVPAVFANFMIGYLGPTIDTWRMFALTSFGTTVSILASVLRSWMSKRVAPEEIGALFSYTGCMEVVMAAVAAAVFDTMFPTLGQDSFYIIAALYAVILPLVLALLFIHGLRMHMYRRQFKFISSFSTPNSSNSAHSSK